MESFDYLIITPLGDSADAIQQKLGDFPHLVSAQIVEKRGGHEIMLGGARSDHEPTYVVACLTHVHGNAERVVGRVRGFPEVSNVQLMVAAKEFRGLRKV